MKIIASETSAENILFLPVSSFLPQFVINEFDFANA